MTGHGGSSPRSWGTRARWRSGDCQRRFIPTLVGNATGIAARTNISPVHPHACGERGFFRFRSASGHGSSPRSWGTQRSRERGEVRARFIPTLVGNADSTRLCSSAAAVHPHACGERATCVPRKLILIGSSPRSWGTLRQPVPNWRFRRFIPTLVGNAARAAATCRAQPVHPHARGERLCCGWKKDSRGGSSPRSWGTRGCSAKGPCYARFIPTLVGNARAGVQRQHDHAVHPHARGERPLAYNPRAPLIGSSPRSWGTLVDEAGRRCNGRFIPTLVGNAATSALVTAISAVHPHARGERRASRIFRMTTVGSSPRSWGTHHRPVQFERRDRFIPTLVGNAARRRATHRKLQVHPHARGERGKPVYHEFRDNGSSPRSWGTLREVQELVLQRRFIPTLVGNAPARPARGSRWSVHPHARGERRN